MRYLSIITPSLSQIACIDTSKPIKENVTDAIYYVEKLSCFGILSNYRNPLANPFQRTNDKKSTIKLNDLPKRLEGSALIELLESLMVRGKDKKPRQMHSNSLLNLRPARPFKKGCSPRKPKLVTNAKVTEAVELREQGFSWRTIGDKLGLNAAAVRMGVLRSYKQADFEQKIKPSSGVEIDLTYYPTVEL